MTITVEVVRRFDNAIFTMTGRNAQCFESAIFIQTLSFDGDFYTLTLRYRQGLDNAIYTLQKTMVLRNQQCLIVFFYKD